MAKTATKPTFTAEVKSKNSERVYTISLINGVASCTCPAWKFQRRQINQRLCKHLLEFTGVKA